MAHVYDPSEKQQGYESSLEDLESSFRSLEEKLDDIEVPEQKYEDSLDKIRWNVSRALDLIDHESEYGPADPNEIEMYIDGIGEGIREAQETLKTDFFVNIFPSQISGKSFNFGLGSRYFGEQPTSPYGKWEDQEAHEPIREGASERRDESHVSFLRDLHELTKPLNGYGLVKEKYFMLGSQNLHQNIEEYREDVNPYFDSDDILDIFVRESGFGGGSVEIENLEKEIVQHIETDRWQTASEGDVNVMMIRAVRRAQNEELIDEDIPLGPFGDSRILNMESFDTNNKARRWFQNMIREGLVPSNSATYRGKG